MLSSLFSGGLTLTLALAPVGAVTVEPTQIIRANSPTLQAQAIDLNEVQQQLEQNPQLIQQAEQLLKENPDLVIKTMEQILRNNPTIIQEIQAMPGLMNEMARQAGGIVDYLQKNPELFRQLEQMMVVPQ
jgi:tRNA-dihydrouridine synthase